MSSEYSHGLQPPSAVYCAELIFFTNQFVSGDANPSLRENSAGGGRSRTSRIQGTYALDIQHSHSDSRWVLRCVRFIYIHLVQLGRDQSYTQPGRGREDRGARP